MSRTLLEQWKDIAYDESADRATLQRFWGTYFQIEKEIYEQLLSNPDEEVKGRIYYYIGEKGVIAGGGGGNKNIDIGVYIYMGGDRLFVGFIYIWCAGGGCFVRSVFLVCWDVWWGRCWLSFEVFNLKLVIGCVVWG